MVFRVACGYMLTKSIHEIDINQTNQELNLISASKLAIAPSRSASSRNCWDTCAVVDLNSFVYNS